MAQGSKYTDEQKEKALVLLIGKSIKEVSKLTNIPEGTLKDWQKKESEVNPKFNELRDEKKKKFAESAWRIIEKANTLLEMRVDRELNEEKTIVDFLKRIKNNPDVSADDVKAIRGHLARISIDSASQLTTIIGTLYDKQALVNKESTVNFGADASFEEILKKVYGKEM